MVISELGMLQRYKSDSFESFGIVQPAAITSAISFAELAGSLQSLISGLLLARGTGGLKALLKASRTSA